MRVTINGAGGQALIDGNPEQWLGEHTTLRSVCTRSEFIPPNTECCDAPQSLRKEIPAGEGTFEVVGTIPFKPAVIRASSSADVSCGGWGRFTGPDGQITVQMTAASLSVKCTVIPLAGSTETPKTIDVPLVPGRTFTIPGP